MDWTHVAIAGIVLTFVAAMFGKLRGILVFVQTNTLVKRDCVDTNHGWMYCKETDDPGNKVI